MSAVRRMEIITPKDFVGPIMELAQQRRGDFIDMTYLTETRTTLVYDLPLAEVRPPYYTVLICSNSPVNKLIMPPSCPKLALVCSNSPYHQPRP